MSFILEALKKSEQQRQQQNTSPQKVRKRTLSLQSSRSDGGVFPWVLAGLLLLALFSGWWFYNKTKPTLEQPPAMDRSKNAPAPLNSPRALEAVVASPAETSSPQQTVEATPSTTNVPKLIALTASSPTRTPEQIAMAAQPAPVPNIYAAAPTIPAKRTSKKRQKPAVKPQKDNTVAATEMLTIDEHVATVSIAQPQPPAFNRMPRYQDLSEELRDRMPPMSMSMHFYNKSPDRRLVRINDRLLHEGDWVDRDLQLVEITGTGATLDFLGKSFEMRSARR